MHPAATVSPVANTAADGIVPEAVRYAFYLGGVVLLLAVGWTVLSTKEMPPGELHATDTAPRQARAPLAPSRAMRDGSIESSDE